MFDWLKRIWPPAPKQVAPKLPQEIKLPFARGYTLAEFRANAALVENTRKLFEDSALGGHLLAVMMNEIPSGEPTRGQTLDPTTAGIGLGEIRGYMRCMKVLQACCDPLQADVVPEVDYGAADAKDGEWENMPLNMKEP